MKSPTQALELYEEWMSLWPAELALLKADEAI
jgi:hypothetical protein